MTTTRALRAGRTAAANPEATRFLRAADPWLARRSTPVRISARGRGKDELPPLDAFGMLVFQVIGQQISVSAARTILARVEQRFDGRLPSPAELLAADPQAPRATGMSRRKAATLRAIAERFLDGRLSDEALAAMDDSQVEVALTAVPGIGPWTARGFLFVALDRPDVFLPATPRSSGHTASTTSRRSGDGTAGRALATVPEPRRGPAFRIRV
jgi:DNA-3-methyladenine glycosylase II